MVYQRFEHREKVPTVSRHRTFRERAREERSHIGNHATTWTKWSIQATRKLCSLLRQTWNLFTRGACTRTHIQSEGLVFKHVKFSSFDRTEQVKRKLSHLGQNVTMKIENSLWTAAHLSTWMSQNELLSGEKILSGPPAVRQSRRMKRQCMDVFVTVMLLEKIQYLWNFCCAKKWAPPMIGQQGVSIVEKRWTSEPCAECGTFKRTSCIRCPFEGVGRPIANFRSHKIPERLQL